MTAIRLAVLICVTSLLNGCILFMFADRSGPPPQGYKVFQGYHVRDDEIIKQDMRDCGFPNVINESEYYNTNLNAYVQSNICMEKKGYTKRGRREICKAYPETEACQKHLSETQGKENRK